MLISDLCQYFLLKKCEASLIFSTKNIGVVCYNVVKHLMSWPLNELVKLTMLLTTGPRTIVFDYKMVVFPSKTILKGQGSRTC